MKISVSAVVLLNCGFLIITNFVIGANVPLEGGIAGDSSGNVYVTGSSLGSGGTGLDFATIKYNSSGVDQWTSRYNGSGGGEDIGYAITVDGSGNVYVTGSSLGSGGTGLDYATVKYNSTGTQQWVSRYNGPGNGDDIAYAIAVDGSGNVYVTGSSSGSGTGLDYATVKYNSSGTQQWVSRYNGPANAEDISYSISVDSSGNVYVTGSATGSGTARDFATVKYNSSGTQQWASSYNGTGGVDDIANSIAVDGSGNVYVTGSSLGSGTSLDFATVKYNSSGTQQWASRYNGPASTSDIAYSIAVDSSGNVYVTGSSGGSGTGLDYATVKYNSFGTQQWASRYNGSGSTDDIAYSVAVDSTGNVYVTGSSGAGAAGTNFATLKYNSSGTQQWASTYNGPGNGNDKANSLVIDASGNVYVTGSSLGSGTSLDYATIKYTSTGSQSWASRYNGTGNGDDISAIFDLRNGRKFAFAEIAVSACPF